MDFIAIAAVSVSVVVGIVLAASWPVETALGGYAFLLPFDTVLGAGSIGTIRLHVTWFVGIAGGCILLLTGLQHRGFLRGPKVARWLILFVIWCGMTAAWALYPDNVAFRMPLIAVLLFVYLTGVCLPVTNKELTRVAWLSILGACLASAICLRSFYQGNYWYPQTIAHADVLVGQAAIGRATLLTSSSITDPDILAASLILPLSLALGLSFSNRSWIRKTILMLAIGLICVTIFLTGSRGALLSVMIVVLVFLVRSRDRWKLIVPIVLLAGVMTAAPGFFLTRITQAMEDRGAGRIDIWTAGIEALKHYPILGAGLDCFPLAYNKYVFLAFDFKGYNRASHNIYLGVATELGIVGLALLLTFIVANLRLAARFARTKHNDAYHVRLISHEAACYGLLVCAFFLDIQWDPYFWLAWMVLVLGVRAPVVSESRTVYDTGLQTEWELEPIGTGYGEVY